MCGSTLADCNSDTLIADLRIRGVWQPCVDAIFDVRVVDTDAPSYRSHSPHAVLQSAESEKKKKKKYGPACLACCACFTPLCFSVNGVLGKEADYFLCQLADQLSIKWDEPYSSVVGWIRACFSFAILRATMICVRGSRVKWRSLGIVYGVSVIETFLID